MRDIVERNAPIEPIPSARASGKEAVGYRLREQIGEIVRCQRPDEISLKRLEETGEPPGRVAFLLNLLADHIAEEARALCQFNGEGFGGERRGQCEIEKAVEKHGEVILIFQRRRCAQRVEHHGPPRHDCLNVLTVSV